MAFLIPDMSPAMAEIVLGTGICVVLLVDLFITDRWRDITYLLAVATLAVTAWVAGSIGIDSREITFNGSFIADPLARILKLFALAVVATVGGCTTESTDREQPQNPRGAARERMQKRQDENGRIPPNALRRR